MKTLIVMQETCGWYANVAYLTGTAAVSAYVKKMAHNVVCLNLSASLRGNKGCGRTVYDYVKSQNPDVVAAGALVTDWVRLKEICDAAKLAKPDVKIVIGGGLVTYSAEEAMRIIPNADFGIIGEGEITLRELLLALENGNSTDGIAGLIYKNSEGSLIVTQRRDDIPNLDELPFLDYEGFSLFEEISRTGSFAITSSRSCPFGCTYCTHSGGGRYRQQSLDRVFAEIDYVVKHVPQARALTIYDELFAVNTERFGEFIDRIAPYNLEWFLPMRADSIKDPEVFIKASAAGCKEMQIGLESGSDTVLKSMRKGTSKDMLRKAHEILKNADITINSNLIFGDTMETMETVEESFAFVDELRRINPRLNVRVSAIKLYPGSPLYDRALADKKITDSTLHVLENIPFVNVSMMTDCEYNYLVKRIIPAKLIRNYVQIMASLQGLSSSVRRKASTTYRNSYTYMRIVNIDYNEEVYHLGYTCPVCRAEFSAIAKEITFNIDFDESSFCTGCKTEKCKIHRAMLLDERFFDAIKPILMKMLEDGNLGITGLGSFFACYYKEFTKLFDEIEAKSSNKIILSDGGSEIADISMVGGRMIHYTDRILGEVNNIVVMSDFYSEIRDRVNSNNPDINVYGLFELPFALGKKT